MEASEALVYTVRRSRRRRRTMEITVRADAGIVVAAPLRVPEAEIEAFVRRRARWIARQLAEAGARPAARAFTEGERFPYLGSTYLLRTVDGPPAVRIDGPFLEVSLPRPHNGAEPREGVAAAVEGWYRRQARDAIAASVRRYGPPAGVAPAAVRLSDAKTQWGSCGPGGTLRINWRLVLAPLEVLDYVVVHELCHLRRADHSARFWALVRAVLPDYESRRAALRRDGARYRL